MCRICQQNTMLFCTFEGAPDIVRLYGKGRAVLPNDSEWAEAKGADGLVTYQGEKNVRSLDGLAAPPGLGLERQS